MDRASELSRETKETNICLYINIDGKSKYDISTGIGFFDHMLTLMAVHSGFDLNIRCAGDRDVDNHHSVEDIGIVLGNAFKEALGDKRGITRYSTVYIPMDEAMAMVSVDISGRAYLHYNMELDREYVGDLETELIEEFFRAFACNAGITLHINLMYGKNTHHKIEAVFKAFGRVLSAASKVDSSIEGVMSSKGCL